MEVHQHSRHGKKKWTEYLWEFLMLFLAVFCGFLAEYQLEHVIEHNKEKEYITSMLEDLDQDTTEINRVLSLTKETDRNCDTLLTILESPISRNSDYLKKLYLLHYYAMAANMAVFSQRTISQLKNAGGLRLIRNKNVADSITLYDNKLQYLSVIVKSYDDISNRVTDAGNGIFDNRYIRHDFKEKEISLLTYDQKVLRQYTNCLYIHQNVTRYYFDYLLQQKQLAIALIWLIRKKYHFK
jgi:hypothetical protein